MGDGPSQRASGVDSGDGLNNLGSDALPLFELLAPTMLVLGAVYLLGPMLPLSRSWARAAIFGIVWIVVARYHHWRLFTTVLPAHGAWYEIGWIWFCYLVELFAIIDAFILYLTFARTTDRRSEANLHESRLRGTSSEQFPSVDVYIPTYNESIDVLEKTIVGALCLDYPNYQIWVLDDGRRPWLKAFCESKGVGYLTRPDNAHAKAGNINHALTKTDGAFVAIFDADFIPQRNFLMRTIGFFDDQRIGIVQVPHAFYNHDPMQANLALRKALPDDQRFFFEAIMPSRDAWNAAFCCGSNSVTRRAALRAVGDELPTGSITEDMLLSLAMLRHGYVTRYLCERLAFGLAPESLKAFFVQRQRWARGATQILFLAEGPFGRNLSFMQRLLFLPTHWLTQSAMLLMTIIAPLVFLLTGLTPLVNVTTEAVLNYIVPMVLAVAGGLCVFAPRQYFPLASQVLGTFQSFKILPTVLVTLVKPFGHVFQVTPKGGGAAQSQYERGIFWIAAGLIALTIGGLMINSIPEWHIVTQTSLLPMVAIWAAMNILVLFLVCMMSLQTPVRRSEERFELDEPLWIFGANGALSTGRIRDISLSGAAIVADADRALVTQPDEPVRVFITEVGFINATVVRQSGRFLAVQFALPPSVERALLISKLFTVGLDTADVQATAGAVTVAMLRSIWLARSVRMEKAPGGDEIAAAPVEKYAARSLVVLPTRQIRRLVDIGSERRSFAV
jgi:cellulose synthase (UDP-forming)